jgi:hypothetical protein
MHTYRCACDMPNGFIPSPEGGGFCASYHALPITPSAVPPMSILQLIPPTAKTVCMYACMYVCMYVCINACVCTLAITPSAVPPMSVLQLITPTAKTVCMHVCVCVCMYVLMHVYVVYP